MRTPIKLVLAVASAVLAAGCGGSLASIPGPAAAGSTTSIAATSGAAAAAAIRSSAGDIALEVPDASSGGPAALLCPHFASNPMCHTLPSRPSVIGQSGAWAALEFGPGRDSFGGLQITNAANPYLDGYDDSEPLERLAPGAASIRQAVSCDKQSYSPEVCGLTGINGKIVNVPADMVPEGNADHHFSYDDPANNREVDFWDSDMPSGNGGVLHVGGAGFCKWGSDGTGCSGSTATQIDTGLGGIDPVLLKSGESDSVHGTLPYALSASAVCDDVSTNFVYPAKASDGDNSDSTPACAGHLGAGGRPPEGTRWFLALHDADVDATNNAPYVKVILRTVDEDHFGGVVTDTNWGGAAEGLAIQFHRGNYAFAAAEAGIYYGTDVYLPVSTNGIDLAKSIEFCRNGTC